MDKSKYIKALEDFICDELLPAYIENARRRGIDPNQSEMVKKLINLMRKKREIPVLLQSWDAKK
jgi:hypothetical protein